MISERTALLERPGTELWPLRRESDRAVPLPPHDVLAGLSDALEFARRSARSLASCARAGRLVALLLVDLDGDRLLSLQPRIGAALFPFHGRTLDTLLAGAARAQGRARREQRGVVLADGPVSGAGV